MSLFSALLASYGPSRIYVCNDASGALADSSGNGQNATVGTSGAIYAQTGVLNSETTKGVNFNGGSFQIPITGFPTGAIAGGMAWGCFVRVGTVPSGFRGLMVYGTEVTSESLQLAFNSSGQPYAALKNIATVAGPVPVSGEVVFYGLDLDASGNLRLYVNGISQGSVALTGGNAPNIVAGAMYLDAFSDGSSRNTGNWICNYAFVRSAGNLTAAQWLALAQAAGFGAGTVHADTFAGRTVAGSLGTASDGSTWTDQAASIPTLSVGSGEGQATSAGSPTNRALETLPASGNTDCEVLFRTSISLLTTQADIYALLRFQDTSNYYWLGLGWISSGVYNAMIRKRVAGTNTTITSAAFSVTANTFYWIRARCQGSVLQLRIWADGGSEPVAWTLATSDTALTTGTIYGLAPYATNNAVVKFDTLTINAPTVYAPGSVVAPGAMSGSAIVHGNGSIAAPAALSGGATLHANGSVVAPASLTSGNPTLHAGGSIAAPCLLAGSAILHAGGVILWPVVLNGSVYYAFLGKGTATDGAAQGVATVRDALAQGTAVVADAIAR